MGSDKHRGAVWRWVREGPDNTDGTIGFMIAMLLWWRTWGFVYATMGGLLLAGAITQYVLDAPLVVGYFTAIILSSWLLNLSGKYNVTKNY